MIKKLISLALASISTLALAGCGATDNPVMDTSVMGDGKSNKTGLGGYWWTYVDRSAKSSVTPDTGKTDPFDTTKTPAELKPSIAEGNGIENGAYHVKGVVGVSPKYDDTTVWDTYWDGFYGVAGSTAPNVCGPDGCREMKYPAVGLGFGFKAKNVPLGKDADGKVGIAFKMKITAGEHPDITTAPINVSLPMDLTDVPDPTYGDLYGSKYANFAPTGNAAAGTNTPICTFPGTITGTGADGKPTFMGSNSKTCFANMTTDGNLKTAAGTTTTLPVTAEWQTFCLGWAAFGPPTWAKSGLAAAKPVGISTLEPLKDRIIKLQFDAFKPPDTAAEAVKFDFWVNDVILLDDAKWKTVCKDANVFPAAS